jgi:hypothetical protein
MFCIKIAKLNAFTVIILFVHLLKRCRIAAKNRQLGDSNQILFYLALRQRWKTTVACTLEGGKSFGQISLDSRGITMLLILMETCMQPWRTPPFIKVFACIFNFC